MLGLNGGRGVAARTPGVQPALGFLVPCLPLTLPAPPAPRRCAATCSSAPRCCQRPAPTARLAAPRSAGGKEKGNKPLQVCCIRASCSDGWPSTTAVPGTHQGLQDGVSKKCLRSGSSSRASPAGCSLPCPACKLSLSSAVLPPCCTHRQDGFVKDPASKTSSSSAVPAAGAVLVPNPEHNAVTRGLMQVRGCHSFCS